MSSGGKSTARVISINVTLHFIIMIAAVSLILSIARGGGVFHKGPTTVRNIDHWNGRKTDGRRLSPMISTSIAGKQAVSDSVQ